jgi:hypothetical protein
MPLSGEAIRTMNYVDDISVTLRRILTVLPSLTDEERKRVADHIKAADPSYESRHPGRARQEVSAAGGERLRPAIRCPGRLRFVRWR